MKGRGNYLCRRKAAQVEAQGAQLIEDELQHELRELLAWAQAHRATAASSDLPVRPRPEVWEQVVSENDNCLRARCPVLLDLLLLHAPGAPPPQADIIVVNHHLLMADLALRDEIGSYTQNAVLPPSARVIIDEAHHLEDVATSYFGTQREPTRRSSAPSAACSSRRDRAARACCRRWRWRSESIDAPATRPARAGRRALDRGAPAAAAARACWSMPRSVSPSCSTRCSTLPRAARSPPRPTPPTEKLRITAAVRETQFWRIAVAAR